MWDFPVFKFGERAPCGCAWTGETVGWLEGAWCMQGCCGSFLGCAVLSDIRFCPLCGKPWSPPESA